MKKYVADEYYSVIWKNTGRKYCDCGLEYDAMNIVSMRPDELTYVKSTNHLMGPVIDIELPKALPTSNIATSPPEYYEALYPDISEYTKEPVVKTLPDRQAEPFVV